MLLRPYTFKADVYAYGICMIEIITFGKVSLERHISNNYAFDLKKLQAKFPSDCPKDFAKIAIDTIAYNPDDRPSMAQVCSALEKTLNKLQKNKLPPVPEEICIDIDLAKKRRELTGVKVETKPEIKPSEDTPLKTLGTPTIQRQPVESQKQSVETTNEGTRIFSNDKISSVLVDSDIFKNEKNPFNSESTKKVYSGVEKKTYIRVAATVISGHFSPKSLITIQIHISNKTIKTIEQIDLLLKDGDNKKIDQVQNICPTKMPVFGWDSFPIFYQIPDTPIGKEYTIVLTAQTKNKFDKKTSSSLQVQIPFTTVEYSSEYKYNPHHVFGSPLELIRVRESCDVPKIFHDTIEYSRRNFHLFIPAFEYSTNNFDVNGDKEEISLLKYNYNSGQTFDVQKVAKNPFSLSQSFYEFLKVLPDSLIPSKHFQSFTLISEQKTLTERLNSLKSFFENLAESNRLILFALFNFFNQMDTLGKKLSEKVQDNNFSSSLSYFFDVEFFIRPPKNSPLDVDKKKRAASLAYEMIHYCKYFD